jgi:hypothetical protein
MKLTEIIQSKLWKILTKKLNLFEFLYTTGRNQFFVSKTGVEKIIRSKKVWPRTKQTPAAPGEPASLTAQLATHLR